MEIFIKTPEEIAVEDESVVKRRYNSLAEAALSLQEQNKVLVKEIEVCYAKLENAQKNVDINKQIVQNALTSQNDMKEQFASEINILKNKLKKAQEAVN